LFRITGPHSGEDVVRYSYSTGDVLPCSPVRSDFAGCFCSEDERVEKRFLLSSITRFFYWRYSFVFFHLFSALASCFLVFLGCGGVSPFCFWPFPLASGFSWFCVQIFLANARLPTFDRILSVSFFSVPSFDRPGRRTGVSFWIWSTLKLECPIFILLPLAPPRFFVFSFFWDCSFRFSSFFLFFPPFSVPSLVLVSPMYESPPPFFPGLFLCRAFCLDETCRKVPRRIPLISASSFLSILRCRSFFLLFHF